MGTLYHRQWLNWLCIPCWKPPTGTVVQLFKALFASLLHPLRHSTESGIQLLADIYVSPSTKPTTKAYFARNCTPSLSLQETRDIKYTEGSIAYCPGCHLMLLEGTKSLWIEKYWCLIRCMLISWLTWKNVFSKQAKGLRKPHLRSGATSLSGEKNLWRNRRSNTVSFFDRLSLSKAFSFRNADAPHRQFSFGIFVACKLRVYYSSWWGKLRSTFTGVQREKSRRGSWRNSE